MRTALPELALRHRKMSTVPYGKLLPRDSRLPKAGSTPPARSRGFDQTGDEQDSGVPGAWRPSARRVGQSREFINRHLDQRMTIAGLATKAGVSISHFFKLFKEETGCAPVVYMTRLKMERARDWLITTDWSIKLIAADLGYHDPLYFSRVFKSLTGMAPKAYRHLKKTGAQARR